MRAWSYASPETRKPINRKTPVRSLGVTQKSGPGRKTVFTIEIGNMAQFGRGTVNRTIVRFNDSSPEGGTNNGHAGQDTNFDEMYGVLAGEKPVVCGPGKGI